MLKRLWRRRSRERLPDHQWHATMHRVRGEFEEMPCLRVSVAQARTLFGLQDRVCEWVLTRLESDGFLGRTSNGEYVRQTTSP
jgi:predicted transcriptional regulator of viral defense system